MIRRFLAVLHARNMEFIRDRSSLSWNLLVPALLVAGMAWIFGGEGRPMFKVAVIQQAPVVDVSAHPFLATRHVEFYATAERGAVLEKVKRHQVDMVLELGAAPAYWVNSDSPNGYVLERMLLGTPGPRFEKSVVHGEPIRYIHTFAPVTP